MIARAAAPTKAQALAIMHERHEGMETIGKTFKALHRELDAASPDLGVIRAAAAKIAELSQKASGWFPKGTGPDSARPAPSPKSGKTREDFAAKLRNFQAAAKRSMQPPRAATSMRSRPASATSARPARRATTNIGRRCTTERAADGSSQPLWDLPVRLFHWLLAALIAVQLVVGAQPP